MSSRRTLALDGLLAILLLALPLHATWAATPPPPSRPRPTLEALLKEWLGAKRAALFPLKARALVPSTWGTPLKKGDAHQDYLLAPTPQSRESADTILKLDPASGRIQGVSASIRGVPGAHLERLKELLTAEDLRAAAREQRNEKPSHSTGLVQVFPIASLNARLHFNSAGSLILVEWTPRDTTTKVKTGGAR